MQTDGQTDRQDKANSRFSQFCERACKAYLLSIIFYRMLLPKFFPYFMVHFVLDRKMYTVNY